MLKPYSIVLHFNGETWGYNTLGGGMPVRTLNIGSGYSTALEALTQAQIFTNTLPDETIVVLSAYPIATTKGENDGT